MKDSDCVAFLQRVLPVLGYRWPGFRKVRGQVCKRISRRMRELGLADLGAYSKILETDEQEWKRLDTFCQITISRFYRDRAVFDRLRETVLPDLARKAAGDGSPSVRCWCAGCCSGEEAYTLQALWQIAVQPEIGGNSDLRIVATDTNDLVLERARTAVYGTSSLKDVPADLAERVFDSEGDRRVVRPPFRRHIAFHGMDVRTEQPPGRFDLILCRNLAFTYFDESLQYSVLRSLHQALAESGYLVVGGHETLPGGAYDLFEKVSTAIFRAR